MVIETEQNKEEPPGTKKSWWKEHEEALLNWVAAVALIICLIYIISLIIKYWN